MVERSGKIGINGTWWFLLIRLQTGWCWGFILFCTSQVVQGFSHQWEPCPIQFTQASEASSKSFKVHTAHDFWWSCSSFSSPPQKIEPKHVHNSKNLARNVFCFITTFVHPPSEIPKAVLEGMKRALVVHGCEGLDELSIAGPSKVANRDGAHKRWEVNALDRWFTHSELIFDSRNPSHIDVLWCFMIVNPQKIDYYIDSEYASPTNAIVKKSLFIFCYLGSLWICTFHHGIMGRSLIHPTKMGFSKGLLYNACLQVSDFLLIRSLDPVFFSCCTFGGLIVRPQRLTNGSPEAVERFPRGISFSCWFSGEPAVKLQLVYQLIFILPCFLHIFGA